MQRGSSGGWRLRRPKAVGSPSTGQRAAEVGVREAEQRWPVLVECEAADVMHDPSGECLVGLVALGHGPERPEFG